MKNLKKFLCIGLALVMAALCFTGCGSDNNAQTGAASGNDTSVSAGGAAFKLGGTGPLTGGAAIYGNAAKNGAQIAVDEINAMDGDIKFELNYQDDEHDAEKAVNAYNTLKDWGMQISLGSVTSTPAAATASEAFADRYFVLTPSASAPAVIAGKDNVYQMCFSDPNQGSASAQYMAEKNLGTKIAIIYQNDIDYSKGIYDTFKAEAEKLGLNVVSTTTFTADTQNDFTVQLTEAKNAGADLVYLPIYYTPASLILQQAKDMGYEPTYFGVDGMDGILTLEGFDTSLAEGVMLLTPFNADAEDEKTAAFVSKYKELYGDTPNQFAADAYDCVYAYYEALKKAGATPDMSAEELCSLMISTFSGADFKFDGLTGDGMTWDTTGAVSKEPKGMIIKNGVYVGLE